MFRRADVFDAEGRCIFFSYHGMPIFGLTDLATWLQLCERGDVVYLSEPLSYFRIHPDSHTGSQSSPAYRGAITDWVVFARHALASPDFTIDERRVCLKRVKNLLERKMALFPDLQGDLQAVDSRSEEHTSELQSLMRISYAVFCLKKKKNNT